MSDEGDLASIAYLSAKAECRREIEQLQQDAKAMAEALIFVADYKQEPSPAKIIVDALQVALKYTKGDDNE